MIRLAFLAFLLLALPAYAENPRGVPLHGLSAFGELKYGPDEPFDYANADAPKGGRFAFSVPYWVANQNASTFNTLSTFTLKNDAPPRMELTYDSLMVRALDEPDAVYGLLAESVEISDDGNSYTFQLRPEAEFANGTPVLARDVAYTMLTLAEVGHPTWRTSLSELVDAEVVDERTVRLVFDGTQSPRNILTVVQIPIVSADTFAYRDFEGRHTDPIVGSGPYEVGDYDFGRYIEYRRRPDYWAADLPVAQGTANFDTIRVETFPERQIAFEAFKKGDLNYRQEFTSKTWATAYDFPALMQGRVVRGEMPDELTPSYQHLIVNLRREKFQDPRVRRALDLAFDYEWTNENLFFGAYQRSQSSFSGSEFEATGEPSDAERALLEKVGAPEAAFAEAPILPVTDGSGDDRAPLREASRLLREAGYERNGSMLEKDGEPLTVEILIRSPTFERVFSPYVENLRRIGVDASIRLVDPAQYAARTDTFDFDMTMTALSITATPTEESLRNVFGSSAAKDEGSRNWAGITDPVVDALLEEAGAATNREELTVALRALDRVLRAEFYTIPAWTSSTHRVAYWDAFGVAEKPDYFFAPELLWWWDAEKAEANGVR